MNRLIARSRGTLASGRAGWNLERIAEAAVRLADEGGPEAVSMARVAQQLGYTTMSLYRHVRNARAAAVISRRRWYGFLSCS
jgi:AcrR family transcriptional regulator